MSHLLPGEQALYRLAAELVGEDGRTVANGWVYITTAAVRYVPLKPGRRGVVFTGMFGQLAGVSRSGRALVVGFESGTGDPVILPLKIAPRSFESVFCAQLVAAYERITNRPFPMWARSSDG